MQLNTSSKNLPGELALHFNNNNKKKNWRRERKKIPEFFRWKKNY